MKDTQIQLPQNFIITYFDLDANGYRTATQIFTLKGNI